ncbi:MAG: DEAD/DEAH box helicase, partial [Muribaculaceae bacterium]|nr:DEAD/DEAH box helicase [Muribaculaceae bacterium]
IMQIVRRLPKERQTLMFSATMPPKTRNLAKEILTEPAEISIAVSRPTEKIDQSAYVCYQGQKTPLLINLFKTRHSTRVIVFAASKLKVKDLTRELRRQRFKAAEMHSDLEQNKREEVMNEFRAGKIDILVATDILARGIDIDDIAMVVNYDVPREAEDYVHRIGRTARANADGMAVTLVCDMDQQRFGRIEKFLGYEVKKGEIPAELGEAPEYRPDRRGPAGPRGGRQGGGSRGKAAGQERGRGRKDRAPRRDNRSAAQHPPKAQNGAAPEPQPAGSEAPAQKSGNGGKQRHRGGYNRRRQRPKNGGEQSGAPSSGPAAQE